MCLVALAYNRHPRWRLVLAGNLAVCSVLAVLLAAAFRKATRLHRPALVCGLVAAAMLPVLVGDPGYRSGFMGSLALVVLMTPIVIRNTEEMLRLVSNELREAAYALGVSKSRTIVKVVLRTALPGIVSGCVIAVARIIGESAPLLITAGSTDYYNFSLFNDRVMTLPVFVYNQYVAGNFPLAWAGALVLVLIVLILNLLARVIAKVFAPKG